MSLHSYDLTVLESHLDTFGHVNNATYLQLFEEARWDLITQNGYGLKEIQKSGHGPVILEINLKFKRELRLRQKITIETETLSQNKMISKVTQIIRDENQKACCVAEFTFGLFDLKKRKLIPPTSDWLKALGLEEQDNKKEAEND